MHAALSDPHCSHVYLHAALHRQAILTVTRTPLMSVCTAPVTPTRREPRACFLVVLHISDGMCAVTQALGGAVTGDDINGDGIGDVCFSATRYT
jgi:hypothetical protein